MELGDLNDISKHKDFNVFNSSELVIGIAVPNGNTFTRKQIDSYTDWVRRPQIGAKGLVYVRCNDDGSFKSSVDKFYDQKDLTSWANKTGAKKGDLVLILSGNTNEVRSQMSALRLELAENLNLRNPNEFAPLWVTDFPLLEWDEESNKFHAMHHPFTSPKLDQLDLLKKNPKEVKANAYDLVLNGNEIGGGSIRIHDKNIQSLMFKHLGFSKDEAKEQFGFLMDAFEYGAPPHGGIALGLDRLVAILHGEESIRDYIAFPKNNSGKDVMIDAPSKLDDLQLSELFLKLKDKK
jgi:aspartyl-tRNA synthetase